MDSISFNGKLHFLQNQTGLICANCGKHIVSEIDVKLIKRGVEQLKGAELAKFLASYVDCFGQKCNSKALTQLIELAQNPKYVDSGLKNLALHLEDKGIYSPDTNTLLHNIFDSVLYSADHVIPRSKGGVNRYSNFVPMHSSCNTDRSSASYSELLKTEPGLIENLKKSIALIQARIKSDKAGLTRYKINIPEDYSEKITDALVSQGIDRKLFTVA